jgi:hypothetical protein
MSMSRKELTFASGQDTCAAWFYPATADRGARPIIVLAHGLAGTRRDRLGAFAERFAAAGIAALVFRLSRLWRQHGRAGSIRALSSVGRLARCHRVCSLFTRYRCRTRGDVWFLIGRGQRARRGSGGSQGGRGYQPGSISRQGQPDLHQTSARRGGNEGCSSRRSLFGCRWSAP